MQPARYAFIFAWANAGSKRPANIAIMAITTSNSIKVNPNFFDERSGSIGHLDKFII